MTRTQAIDAAVMRFVEKGISGTVYVRNYSGHLIATLHPCSGPYADQIAGAVLHNVRAEFRRLMP